MNYDRLAGAMHVGLPLRAGRGASRLGVALADGVYLTAWPLWAVLLPALVFAFGFSVGGWHWLPQNIWDGRLTSHPAIAFMQMLPLLVVAVVVGTLSAGLGLLLIAGYAIGDLFISAATYAPYFHQYSIGWWLGHVVFAQLITYLVFLLLAVVPILSARALGASVPGLRSSHGSTKVLLRTLIAAAVMAALVYAWTLMAPMAVRPLWLWTNHSESPVTVHYFITVVDPMLPLIAAGAVLVRALLEALARHSESARRHATRLVRAYRETPSRRGGVQRSGWLGAVTGTIIVLSLLAGMSTRLWPLGIAVFAGVSALFVLFRVILPQLSGWQAWSDGLRRIPLIVRWLIATAGAYAVARAVLAMPGMAVWQNEADGAFGAVLLAVVLGLAFAAALFPVSARHVARGTANPAALARGAVQLLALIAFAALVLHPEPAIAACVASRCCLGDNHTAAMVVAGLGALVLLVVFPAEALMVGAEMAGLPLEALGGLIEAGEIGAGALEAEVEASVAEVLDTVSSHVLGEGIKAVMEEPIADAKDTVHDAIHDTIKGFEDIARSPAPTPYPLGADGGPMADAATPGIGPHDWATSTADVGPVLAPVPGLPTHASAPIGAAEGLQTSHGAAFGGVHVGTPAEPGTHYLWTSDERGVSIAPAHARVPGTDQPIALTNLASHAASGGRVWFGPGGSVNLQLDAHGGFGFAHTPEQIQAIVRM